MAVARRGDSTAAPKYFVSYPDVNATVCSECMYSVHVWQGVHLAILGACRRTFWDEFTLLDKCHRELLRLFLTSQGTNGFTE